MPTEHDLDRRPDAYFDDPQPLLPDADAIATMKELGRMHPAFMGGAYLPDGDEGEVEIVRISLRSVTADVLSVRARPDGDGIAYRVADEYDTEWVLPIARSDRPLSLGEVLTLLREAHIAGDPEARGLSMGMRERNFFEPGDGADLIDFATVTSDFYPELEELDRAEAAAWAARADAGGQP